MIGVLLLDTLALAGTFGAGLLMRPWINRSQPKIDPSQYSTEEITVIPFTDITCKTKGFECPACGKRWYVGAERAQGHRCICDQYHFAHFHLQCCYSTTELNHKTPKGGCGANFVMLAKNAKL